MKYTVDVAKVLSILNEAEDCVRLCELGDSKPINRLLAMLAFELGVSMGEAEKEKGAEAP